MAGHRGGSWIVWDRRSGEIMVTSTFKQGTLFRLPVYLSTHCLLLLLLATADRSSRETYVQKGDISKRAKLGQCLSGRDLAPCVSMRLNAGLLTTSSRNTLGVCETSLQSALTWHSTLWRAHHRERSSHAILVARKGMLQTRN